MNFRIFNLKFLSVFLLANFILCGVLLSVSNAQTPRRTKTGKSRPIVSPTPVPESAEIISRDAEYNLPTQIIQPEKTESQPDTSNDPAESSEEKIKYLNQRILQLESERKNNSSDDKQRRLLLNLDILTRAEQRAETLRKQRFEMIEKESQIRTKLDRIAADIRPELLERQVAFAGSLRPEELRDAQRKNLEIERKNLQTLLDDIQTVRSNLELNVQKADILVKKLQDKLEKEIDDSLADEPQN